MVQKGFQLIRDVSLPSNAYQPKEGCIAKMLPRISYEVKAICLISFAVLLLFFFRVSSRDQLNPKNIQFNHQTGEIGDLLFSLFSHLGVARTIGRTPTINTVNNSILIEELSKVVVVRFPSVLQQFSIVIQPPTPSNGNLGTNTSSYEDPVKAFSEYATLSIMVDGNGFKSYKYFDHLRSKIRLWMMGNAENVQEARNLLSESLRDNFKVCVHTTPETQKNFTVHAVSQIVNHYVKEIGRVMLVVSSEDPGFGRLVFQDPKISNLDIEKFSLVSSPPELQITFSRLYCDVVFVTSPYSSVGWWMGYLAREDNSEVYYFDPEVFPEHVQLNPDDFFPAHWKKVTKKNK